MGFVGQLGNGVRTEKLLRNKTLLACNGTWPNAFSPLR